MSADHMMREAFRLLEGSMEGLRKSILLLERLLGSTPEERELTLRVLMGLEPREIRDAVKLYAREKVGG